MNGDQRGAVPNSLRLDRRVFLVGGAAAATLLAIGPSRTATAASLPAAPTLTRSLFAPAVGKYFWIQGTFKRLTLEEIDDVRGAPAGDENRFSLVFSSPTKIVAGTLPLTNLRLGTISLFVGAVDRGVNNNLYEAVINRLTG